MTKGEQLELLMMPNSKWKAFKVSAVQAFNGEGVLHPYLTDMTLSAWEQRAASLDIIRKEQKVAIEARRKKDFKARKASYMREYMRKYRADKKLEVV
jgi:hypothetical protein